MAGLGAGLKPSRRGRSLGANDSAWSCAWTPPRSTTVVLWRSGSWSPWTRSSPRIRPLPSSARFCGCSGSTAWRRRRPAAQPRRRRASTRACGGAGWRRFGAGVAETGRAPAELCRRDRSRRAVLGRLRRTRRRPRRAVRWRRTSRRRSRASTRGARSARVLGASAAAPPPLLVRDRRQRQYLRRPHRGRSRGRSRRANHRRHPLDRAVAARLRSVRRDDRRVRRHVRDARELPHHARRARRGFGAARAAT